jgi:hypothetical protein
MDGFSLHAGVAAKAHERMSEKKLERICRCIARVRLFSKEVMGFLG